MRYFGLRFSIYLLPALVFAGLFFYGNTEHPQQTAENLKWLAFALIAFVAAFLDLGKKRGVGASLLLLVVVAGAAGYVLPGLAVEILGLVVMFGAMFIGSLMVFGWRPRFLRGKQGAHSHSGRHR